MTISCNPLEKSAVEYLVYVRAIAGGDLGQRPGDPGGHVFSPFPSGIFPDLLKQSVNMRSIFELMGIILQ